MTLIKPQLKNHKFYSLCIIQKVLAIFNACGVGEWAENLKAKYLQEAFDHLESIAVVSARKQPLIELANYLMNRNK